MPVLWAAGLGGRPFLGGWWLRVYSPAAAAALAGVALASPHGDVDWLDHVVCNELVGLAGILPLASAGALLRRRLERRRRPRGGRQPSSGSTTELADAP